MKTTKLRLLVCLASLVVAPAALADTDVEWDALPEPVQMTVDREVGSGQIVEIEIDEEEGSTVYEIEYVLDGTKYELDVAADGTLIRRHRD